MPPFGRLAISIRLDRFINSLSLMLPPLIFRLHSSITARTLALDGRPYKIACGQIDIGNADTDMATKMKQGILQASGSRIVEPTMDVEHVARCVLLMANLPLDANVLSMTVMANLFIVHLHPLRG